MAVLEAALILLGLVALGCMNVPAPIHHWAPIPWAAGGATEEYDAGK